MSTTGSVAFPEQGRRDDVVIAASGAPPTLEKVAWFFSLFLLVFPPVAIVGTYLTDRTVLLSLPLLLMVVCGVFGLRLSTHLEKAA